MKTFSNSPIICLLVAFITFLVSCSSPLPQNIQDHYSSLPDNIDFNFHVKPILSDRCYTCHGPDEAERKADLRLDLEEKAFKSLASGDGKAFYRNHAGRSNAIARMITDDPEEVMPPPETNLLMTDREIAIIAKWIDQGAEYKEHWSFIAAGDSDIPTDRPDEWTATNEIDGFIYKKIKENNLNASEEAEKETLVRRAYLDLTGLPPTIAQLDNHLIDTSSGYYERMIDQLLHSDAYGERLAMEWMDVARYADSHGLHADGWRNMWPWRDWVINAFKTNMPYDDFVTKQLAGDLLPDPSKEDILATAFHRNHTMTAEGGAIDEEFRLSYVFDRAETTATAFLGMTLNCAKCHDHKYDPISQKEYYEMSAFFNNVRELGMTGDDGNYGPMMLYTSETQDLEIKKLEDLIREKENEIAAIDPNIETIKTYIKKLKKTKTPDGLIAHYPFDTEKPKTKDKRTYTEYDNNSKSKSYGKATLAEGQYGKAIKITEDFSEPYLEDVGIFENFESFSVGMWINTTKREKVKTQTLIGNSGEKNNFWRGWEIYLDTLNRLSAALIHSKPHNLIHVTTIDSVQKNEWTHVAMTYDGSSKAKGIKLLINGKVQEIKINYDRLYKSIHPVTVSNHQLNKRALRVAKSGRNYTGENGIYFGRIDDIKLFDRTLSTFEISVSAGIESDIAKNDFKKIALNKDPQLIPHIKALKDLRSNRLQYFDTLQEVMVLEEEATPRTTYAYHRGEYTAPMYEVTAQTPSSILTFPDTLERNRLGLAKWLFSEQNPLTARVTVNRYWQMIFGTGLVSTPQDFGLQGSNPSHPDLLDYLANQLIASDWDIRQLIKTMVMSATYRQDSRGTKVDKENDPNNVFLARGSSYRLSAEMIRDNALAASGLLHQQLGGESVKPYQPEGLWIEKNVFSYKLLKYKENKGDSLYRRSLYTFIKRTSPHPMMTTFDAPNREICTVNRESTNTPLQSLVLMNDPQFVEAGKVLAQRVQIEGGDSIRDQVQFGFRAATSRSPSEKELDILEELYNDQYSRFADKPAKATELLEVGESDIDDSLEPVKTAALTMVSNAILNHDEAYMKR